MHSVVFGSGFCHLFSFGKSPRREVVRSSAGIGVYTPFLGVVRVAFPKVWFLR